MRALARLAIPLVAMTLTGCAMARSPVSGMLYTSVKGPLAVSPQPGSTKVGRASASSILGLVATGDASIEAACKSANIVKIHHIDFEAKSILGLYAKWTTVCYGD